MDGCYRGTAAPKFSSFLFKIRQLVSCNLNSGTPGSSVPQGTRICLLPEISVSSSSAPTTRPIFLKSIKSDRTGILGTTVYLSPESKWFFWGFCLLLHVPIECHVHVHVLPRVPKVAGVTCATATTICGSCIMEIAVSSPSNIKFNITMSECMLWTVPEWE